MTNNEATKKAIRLLKRVLEEKVTTLNGHSFSAIPNGPLRNDIRDFMAEIIRKEAKEKKQ